MINIPMKTKERLVSGVKLFQSILINARAKDINESDTVTIVGDILSKVFGYDKYTEVTSELVIKKTFCDLAVRIDGESKARILIEVKAAAHSLKEQDIRQVVNYGALEGVDWVILTNALEWKVYKITFGRPINMELVFEFDLTQISTKKQSDLELLYYLTREAMSKSSKASLDGYHTHKQIVNSYTLGQIIMTEPVLDAIRKTIKKLSSETKVSNEEICQIIAEKVLKREVLDGDKAIEAKKKVLKCLKEVKKTIVKSTSDISSKTEETM